MNDDEMEAQMEYWKSKAKAAEAERDEWKTEAMAARQHPHFAALNVQRERAEAAETERDEANVQWHKIRDLHADAVSEVHRLNHENGALEEEARALREALRGYMFGGSLDSLKAALGEDV